MFERILTIVPLLFPLGLPAQPAPPAPPAPPITVISPFGPQSGSFLGVGVKEIDSERAKALKLREEHGVEITNVEKESPADKAGLQTGDVVQKYQGQRVEGLEQFVRFVRETPPGRSVTMEVIRGGAPVTLSAVLGKREKVARPLAPMAPDVRVIMPDIPKAMMSWSSGYLGIEGEGLGSSQLADYFGVKDGVLVRSVMKNSAADKAGIQAGDVITKVNETSVSTPRDITAALRAAGTDGKKVFPVAVVREKRESTVSVTIEEGIPGLQRRGRSIGRQQE